MAAMRSERLRLERVVASVAVGRLWVPMQRSRKMITRRALAVTVSTLMAVCSTGWSVPTADAAAVGTHCRSVHAGGYSATHVFVDYMTCRSARTKLRRWLRHGHLPRHKTGWYCSRLGGVVRQCSYPGNSHPSRDFTFWLRRAS